MTAPEPTLPPERVAELAEAVCSAVCEGDAPAAIPHAENPRHRIAACYEHQRAAQALAPLVARWVTEYAEAVDDRALMQAEERGRAIGAAEVRARMEAAIRLVSPDHITPMGARQILAAQATEPEEQP